MEKIYMEENKNKRNKRSVVNTSVVLSFVVAIFAVFSIAMVGISMNQKTGISYAIGTTTESFKFSTGDRVIGNGFSVPMYLADGNTNNPIFCVEHNVDVEDDTTYNKGSVIDDYGLLYLLNNSYANDVSLVDDDTNVAAGKGKYVNAWITQVAIWSYLYETQGSVTSNGVRGLTPDSSENIKVNFISEADYNKIKNTAELYLQDGTLVYSGANLYNKYVSGLVTKAIEASNKKMLSVSKENDEISLTSDEKYYQSSLITVVGNPSSDFNYYSIEVSGIDGAIVVDEDGEELPASIAPGTKFYVRIPADKVTTEVQKVAVNVVGNFDTLTGNYYIGKDSNNLTLQKVVSVTGSTREESASVEVEFVGTEDTGMNTAQTIYFIGLIVLLCGVGIVYANAKPVQVKQ